MEGISFIVRVHNEGDTLEQSVQSLFALMILYEIIIILNTCSDMSALIARRLENQNPNIRIFEYNHSLSRPGYETLATNSNSVHSIVEYYNWSHKKARYKWVAKWDADFVMTTSLLSYLNTHDLQSDGILRMGAVNKEGIVEMNDYFSSCLLWYKKDLFWEMPGYVSNCKRVTVPDVYIQHLSSEKKIKDYWFSPGWFMNVENEESAAVQKRLEYLVRDFGIEPPGFVRSENIPNAIKMGEQIMVSGIDYVYHDQ